MERVLNDTAASFRLMKQGVTDYAIILTDAHGKITSWNAGAERIFGYKEEEVLGRSAALIFTEENRSGRQPELETETALREGRADDERFHLRRDGTTFMASGVLTALWDEDRQLQGFVKVVRDVSDRLKADRLLQQAHLNETIAVLAGGFAHDFNNLLTSIMGNVSLALDQSAASSPEREVLEAALDSSRQAAELTARLLAYAGKGRFATRRLQLSKIVEELRNVLKTSISKGPRLEFLLAGGLPEFLGEPTQIDQVILDLVINAGEAVEKKRGKIVVSTGFERLEQQDLGSLTCDGCAPGDFVYCEVSDEGSGIDPAIQHRIFEPFFSTKFLGRGLGLAAVSGIVRRHKGAIRVTSKTGEGSRFRIYFPETV